MLVNIDLDDVASVVDEAIHRAIAPLARLAQEIEELKTAKPVDVVGPKGDPGNDGKDADLDAVKSLVVSEVEKSSATLLEMITEIESRPPLKGDPGVDGKDAEPAQPGEKGEKGEKGEAGERGPEGPPPSQAAIAEAMLAMPEFETMVRVASAAYLIENPPKDGIDGKDGPIGLDGKEGQAGRDGRDGLPGLPGQKGIDGTDGKDGLGFEDLDIAFDGERTFTFKMARGEQSKEWAFTLPIPIDRGVYRDEKNYQKGDAVSFGGSIFIAQRDTSDKPETSDAWRLGVKRGQNGKDGKMSSPDGTPTVRLK